MNSESTRALRAIASAFPEKARNLSSFFSKKSEDHESEHYQVRTFLQSKDWGAIKRENLRTYAGDEKAILSFLTPEGFAYYLPGFLTVALEVAETDWNFSEAIPFYVTPYDAEPNDYELARFVLLNEAQIGAILLWLEQMGVRSASVDKARTYWLGRLASSTKQGSVG